METAASQDLDGVDDHQVAARLPVRAARAGFARDARTAADVGRRRRAPAQGRGRRHAVPGRRRDRDRRRAGPEPDPRAVRPDPRPRAASAVSARPAAPPTLGYTVLPMQFVNTPNSGGAHLGSAYDGGYEGYVLATLEQLMGQSPADGFGPEITSRECAGRSVDLPVDDRVGAAPRTNGARHRERFGTGVDLDAVDRVGGGRRRRCRCTTRSSSARWASSASPRSTGRTGRRSSR